MGMNKFIVPLFPYPFQFKRVSKNRDHWNFSKSRDIIAKKEDGETELNEH
jgi:hypothetical protein